jgi:hypothetical protein
VLATVIAELALQRSFVLHYNYECRNVLACPQDKEGVILREREKSLGGDIATKEMIKQMNFCNPNTAMSLPPHKITWRRHCNEGKFLFSLINNLFLCSRCNYFRDLMNPMFKICKVCFV